MGYDLNFWRYTPGVRRDHQAVYEQLSNGQEVAGLERLPVSEITARIAEVFERHWQRIGTDGWERDAGGAFQLTTTPQFVRVDCYGMAGDDMNRIIDVLLEFDCPLYDPQAGERFDGG